MTISYGKRAAWSWAFYDFANTIYSAIVVTVYLPLHLKELTQRNWPMALGMVSSLILSALLSPFFGALMDHTGRIKVYLWALTLMCIIATCALAFTSYVPLIIFIFFVANFAYQSSLVFYNAILPSLAARSEQGRLSGLGVGLGYLGVVFALPIAYWIEQKNPTTWVFPVAGVLFFIFALPLFLWVPETHPASKSKIAKSVMVERWGKVSQTLKSVVSNRLLLFFFLGNFLCVDAVNAAIIWFSVYTKSVFGVSQGTLIGLVLALNACAFVGGILMGKLTDRMGSLNTLFLASLLFGLAILLSGLLRSFALFYVAMVGLGSFGIAGLWTAGRKLLVEIAPPQEIGEYFGLYGITGKLSVVGSLLFAVISDHFNPRAAILSQLISLSLGAFFLFQMKKEMPHLSER
jgi:UMF1 family MFS transporter